ncbi:hypothetical protein [Mycobacterium sp.]|uniref:hypothetical protein n=1 Tax=Mycobacterium sp. TaxID=1785 RepID=UPI002BC1DFEF|nr:hypothetical protein [Mycobacterium sp.]HTQ18304.1 hypothetical protein [Mycobacterium sp.]
MTNPEMATILRNMKVPEQMSGSQELRNYLVSYIERGDSEPDPAEQHKLNWLLVISHLEVVNALGALEEHMNSAQSSRSRSEVKRSRKRGRWF